MLVSNYLSLIIIVLIVSFAIFEIVERGYDNRRREQDSARVSDDIGSLAEAVSDLSCHLKAHGELLKMHGDTLNQVHEQMHIQDDAIRKLGEQVKQGNETGRRLEVLLQSVGKDKGRRQSQDKQTGKKKGEEAE